MHRKAPESLPTETKPGDLPMHRVRVVRSYYDQSEPFVGKVGEVIGHWGADNNQEGRDGFMVQFDDGTVIGVSENEVEDASEDQPVAGGEEAAGTA
jgi:hypothetical protein